MNYEMFIQQKRLVAPPCGIAEPPELSPKLFEFQRDITQWALRRGRGAIWADCGLGKSWMAIEWARVVAAHTGRPVLILTPLAVARQFVDEGAKLGVEVNHCRSGEDVRPGINVTNYERLHLFDASAFGGVVLDESSCLKDYTSATRNALVDAFAATPFRLACTATPAPNDHVELGNHAEFLGVMSRTEMLSMFFVHDGGSTQDWRLKGHAGKDFWRWVCSWAVSIRKPSDLGYSDDGYELPPLNIHEHVVDSGIESGLPLPYEARGLDEQRAARRESLAARVAVAASLVNGSPEQWLAWCDLNAESEALAAAIPGSVQVQGSDSVEWKESAVAWFQGKIGCICQQTGNTRTTGQNATQQTRSSEQGNSRREVELQKRTGNTCASITNPTNQSGSAQESSEIASMLPGARSTHRITGTEKSTRRRSRGGRNPTQPSALSKGSESTESDSPSIERSCLDKEEGARFADDKEALTPTTEAGSDVGYMSIIVTAPGKSEGSSVPTATLGSANFTMTPTGLSEPRCICGRDPLRKFLVSKPSIFGLGCNLQSCSHVVFVGLSHSFEAWYQAIRRTYRFGQSRPVECHVVTSSAEGAVVSNLKRKQRDAERMADEMISHMADITSAELRATERSFTDYRPTKKMKVPLWLKSEAA